MLKSNQVVYIGLELVIALLAVAGNILVCWSVCLNSNLQSITNFFVVSLAVADIAVGLLAIPFAITIRYNFMWFNLGQGLRVYPYNITVQELKECCTVYLLCGCAFLTFDVFFPTSAWVSVVTSMAACSSLALSSCSLRAPSSVCWLLLLTAILQ